MSWLLFDAMPSVPRHTFTPRASIFATGAKPLPSFMFDAGFAATNTPRSASTSMSPSSTHTQCAAVTGTSSTPRLSK